MENILLIDKQEKIIADLLIIKKELDGRKESIFDDPIAVLFGNPLRVLEEGLGEFLEKEAQFRYKAGIYLSELELNKQEIIQINDLITLKEQNIRNGKSLRNLELIINTPTTIILAIPIIFFVKNLVVGILLLVGIWYVKDKIIDVKADLIHEAQDYGWLKLYFEETLKVNT